MLLADEDIRNAPLSRDPLERILESGSILCNNNKNVSNILLKSHSSSRERSEISPGVHFLVETSPRASDSKTRVGGLKRTDFIQLHEKILRPFLAQQRLGRLAVRAVALAEDDDGVVVDDGLGLGLCCGHGGGGGAGAEAAEQAAQEGCYCCGGLCVK